MNWKTIKRRLHKKRRIDIKSSLVENVPTIMQDMVFAYHMQQRAKKIKTLLLAFILIALAPAVVLSATGTTLLALIGASALGSIHYPSSGTIYYGQFQPDTLTNTITRIKTALISCGWTSTAVPNKVVMTFTGVPSNGQGFTIDGVSYTFKTTINNANAREITIGATATDCARNMQEAITAGAGSGTDYSSATTAHPTLTASRVGTVVTVYQITPSTTTFTVSSGTSNASFDIGTSYNGGFNVLMPTTSDGLSGGVIIDVPYNSQTYGRIRAASKDFSTLLSATDSTGSGNGNGSFGINVQTGRTLEFFGCGHQFGIFLAGDTGTSGTKIFFTIPKLRDFNIPLTVTSATNASPIVLGFSVAHNLSTGDDVYNADIAGNTAANGFFTATVVDSTHISLNGSTGNGAYTSGGISGHAFNQISRTIYIHGDSATQSWPSWRTRLDGNTTSYWVTVNQYSYGTSFGGTNVQLPSLFLAQKTAGNNNAITFYSWGLIPDLIEPRLIVPVQTGNSIPIAIGYLWAAFVVMENNVMDRINTGFNAHNWFNLTASDSTSNASLWFAKS